MPTPFLLTGVDESVERLLGEAAPRAHGAETRPVAPMQTLILGSDADVYTAALHARGYDVHVTDKLEAAWDVYRQTHPYLVVLADADADGLTLCRRIRAGANGEATLVLAQIDPDDADRLQAAVAAGVDDCIPPAASPMYIATCLKLLERRARKRARHLQVEQQLASRARQQAAVAALGQRVLASESPQEAMDYAVEAVAQALDVEFSKLLMRAPHTDGLLLQAGVGWKEGLVGTAIVETGAASQAGYTLSSSEPVVVENLSAETRFTGTALLHEHGIVSGMSVILKVDGAPYGVLAAHATEPRSFNENDVNFLQAVANVLAHAIERQRAEQRLIKERNFVSAVLDTVGALVVVLDTEGRIIRFNRACERTTGYRFEEVEGYSIWDAFLPPENHEAAQHTFDALRQGKVAHNEYENDWIVRDGSRRRIAWSNTVLHDATEAVEYVVATGIDVTERRQAEEAFAESQARAQAILQTTVDGIITIDEHGIIETFNPAAEEIFGYEADEVIGENVKVLMPAPFREEHDGYIQSYLETGHRKIIGIGREVVGLRKDGTTFPLELAVSEVQLDSRRIFTGMVRDVTKRRHLEQEILRISEEERRRIGQDLHDGLGQMLTGIGLIAQSLTRSLEQRNLPEADDMAEVTELVKEADEFARMLARGLVPVDLEATGLAAALDRLAHNAERLFGIRCTFEKAGSVLIHDNTVATHLYRIAQEAVSNAVKHGRAQHVKISLASGVGRIRLRLQDDGIGFPEHLDEERQGMGVRIMHYRARVIGATLEIGESLDGGTTITCTLRHRKEPIHSADGAAA